MKLGLALFVLGLAGSLAAWLLEWRRVRAGESRVPRLHPELHLLPALVAGLGAGIAWGWVWGLVAVVAQTVAGIALGSWIAR